MSRQAADAGDASDADQRAGSALAHRLQEGLEGRGHAEVVGLERGAQLFEIGELGAVDADADAGAGNHHVGHAVRLDALAADGGDAIDIAHVGAIDGDAVGAETLRRSPRCDGFTAARDERKPETGACIARCERLANAARRAGDEGQARAQDLSPRTVVLRGGKLARTCPFISTMRSMLS